MKDDVIKMARAAGFCVNEDGSAVSTNNSYGIVEGELERFAALVRADEREHCAKVCENQDPYVYSETTANACAFAIRARHQG